MSLSSEEMGGLFKGFRRSAFRMETHQTYTIPSERDSVRRFLAGQPKPVDHNAGWHATVRANVAGGKSMQRLKVIRRPFSDYIRYHLAWSIPGNVQAGEDYRILELTDRSELGIPEQDYWMFDDQTVALLNFNPDGTLAGRELADPSDLEQYRKWRDLALSEAVRFVDYRG